MNIRKNVPIPMWMSKLPRDKRGYPIPFIVSMEGGRPHFTVNEESRRQQAIKKDLCSICGRKLLKRRAVVGGPLSAFHPQGTYIDAAMHVECCRYALQVCPYLAMPSYVKRIEGKTMTAVQSAKAMVLVDNTMNPDRPSLFVMVIHTKADHITGSILSVKLVQYIKPCQPYVAVEYWQAGKQISDEEGLALSKQALQDVMKAEFDELLIHRVIVETCK